MYVCSLTYSAWNHRCVLFSIPMHMRTTYSPTTYLLKWNHRCMSVLILRETTAACYSLFLCTYYYILTYWRETTGVCLFSHILILRETTAAVVLYSYAHKYYSISSAHLKWNHSKERITLRHETILWLLWPPSVERVTSTGPKLPPIEWCWSLVKTHPHSLPR